MDGKLRALERKLVGEPTQENRSALYAARVKAGLITKEAIEECVGGVHDISSWSTGVRASTIELDEYSVVDTSQLLKLADLLCLEPEDVSIDVTTNWDGHCSGCQEETKHLQIDVPRDLAFLKA